MPQLTETEINIRKQTLETDLQNVKRESVDKVTIKNNKINRVATLKKLDDLLN